MDETVTQSSGASQGEEPSAVTDYAVVDSRRLTVAEHRRVFSGAKLALALLLKALRIRLDGGGPIPTKTKFLEVDPGKVDQGALLRLGVLIEAFEQLGFESIGMVDEPAARLLDDRGQPVGPRTTTALLRRDRCLAIVNDIEENRAGVLHRETHAMLLSRADGGPWLVTTSLARALDAPPGVELEIVGGVQPEALMTTHEYRCEGLSLAALEDPLVELESYRQHSVNGGLASGKLRRTSRQDLMRRMQLTSKVRARPAVRMGAVTALVLWVVIFTVVVLVWNLLISRT